MRNIYCNCIWRKRTKMNTLKILIYWPVFWAKAKNRNRRRRKKVGEPWWRSSEGRVGMWTLLLMDNNPLLAMVSVAIIVMFSIICKNNATK